MSSCIDCLDIFHRDPLLVSQLAVNLEDSGAGLVSGNTRHAAVEHLGEYCPSARQHRVRFQLPRKARLMTLGSHVICLPHPKSGEKPQR